MKRIVCLLAFCFLLMFSPMQSVASEQTSEVTTEAEKEEAFNKKKKVSLHSRKFKTKSVYQVCWNFYPGADGYHFELCTNKSFRSKYKPSKVYVGPTINTMNVQKIKKNITYYYRLRAYKEKSSGKKIYSKWSKTYSIKRKK